MLLAPPNSGGGTKKLLQIRPVCNNEFLGIVVAELLQAR